MDALDGLRQARQAYARRAWMDAYQALSEADRATPLGAEDLELLATSAYMVGRDDDFLRGLERAHQAHLQAGEAWATCARCRQGAKDDRCPTGADAGGVGEDRVRL